MTLIMLVITLIVVGVLLWLVNSMIPMDPKIKTIINVIVIIAVIIWLLAQFGVLNSSFGSTRLHVEAIQKVLHIG